MLRQAMLVASRNPVLTRVVTTAPGISTVVRRFAAGESEDDAVTATADLVGRGFQVTLDHLGERGIGDDQRARGRRQRRVAAPADGLKPAFDLSRGDPVRGAAIRASDQCRSRHCITPPKLRHGHRQRP